MGFLDSTYGSRAPFVRRDVTQHCPVGPAVNTPVTAQSRRRPHAFRRDIEGLRAIAVLLVVAYHVQLPIATGGFIGVDVFFVLSGYLISGLLFDEGARTGTISLANFWARRARRLLPAAALVFVAVLIGAWLLGPSYWQQVEAGTAITAAVYSSNVLFSHRHWNYLGPDISTDALLHTWSLSIEEQFYLLLAPLLWLLVRYGVRKFDPAACWRRVMTAAVVFTFGSFALCLWMVRRAPADAFYGFSPRAWEFGVGAILSLWERGPHASAVLGWVHGRAKVISVLALAGLLIAVTRMNVLSIHPGPVTAIPVLCTAAMLAVGTVTSRTLVSRLLALGPFQWIGRLSYSWYLWHWPALAFLNVLVRHTTMAERLAVAVGTLGLAALSYSLVEAPLRFSPWLSKTPQRSLVVALGLALTVVTVAAVMRRVAQEDLSRARYARIREAHIQRPAVYADGCHADLRNLVPRLCAFGRQASDTTIVLFGDSHAAQYFPALTSFVQSHGWRLIVATKSSCPSVTVSVYEDALRRLYSECDTWRTRAIAEIDRLRPTLILLSNAYMYRVMTNDGPQIVSAHDLAEDTWASGVSSTLRMLAPSRAKVLFLEGSPQPDLDVPNCLAMHLDEPGRCDLPYVGSIDAQLAARERSVAAQFPFVFYRDLSPYICSGQICPAERDDVVVYQDASHLSVPYVKSLGPILDNQILAVLATHARAGLLGEGSSVGRVAPAN